MALSAVTEVVLTQLTTPHGLIHSHSHSDLNSTAKKKENLYCGLGWKSFGGAYNAIDDNFMFVLCLITVIFNLWNLLVFFSCRWGRTRDGPGQRTSPGSMDIILGSLAIADLLFALRKVVDLTLRFFRQQYGIKRTSYNRELESIIQDFLANLFHTWSIYLTMLAGFWFLWSLYKGRRAGSLSPATGAPGASGDPIVRRVKIIVVSMILFSTAMVIFMFSPTRITEIERQTMSGGTLHKLKKRKPNYMRTRSPVGTAIFYCIYGFLIKLGPCIIITILLAALCCYNWFLRRNGRNTPNKVMEENGGIFQEDEVDTTSTVLMVLLFLFVATEFPVGIFKMMVVYPGIKTFDYTYECLWPLINFLNMNENISSVTSFLCYISISSAFRQRFVELCKSSWRLCRHCDGGGKKPEIKDNLYSSDGSIFQNYKPTFLRSPSVETTNM